MTDAPVDYRPMWTSLGLDLEAHDVLLTAIPQLYTDAYLGQQDCPEGMAYFDFVMSEIHGLRIKESQDHKAAGGTVIAAGVDGEVLVAPEPQTVGALGAALHGARQTHQTVQQQEDA
jgi:hypothetical protein